MGLSLGHIILLLLVGIIVVGPKNLPAMMRTAGQWVARLRRMSVDLRSQSGIDDLLRQEGLDQHINELRSLSRFNVVDTLMTPAAAAPPAGEAAAAAPPAPPTLKPVEPRPQPWEPQEPLRAREYPVVGCDAYGAVPDDMPVPADPYVSDEAAQPAPPAETASDAEPVPTPGLAAPAPPPAPAPAPSASEVP